MRFTVKFSTQELTKTQHINEAQPQNSFTSLGLGKQSLGTNSKHPREVPVRLKCASKAQSIQESL